MDTPVLPKNELQRLRALWSLQILDSDREERFDLLTRLAARTLSAPIALISLLDENRQWFKSRVGLDVQETSRDVSFCGHAINADDIFVVEDATKDERFFDNPLVTEGPKIRFYAGYPLKGPQNHKVGTLCIIDSKPRTLSDADNATLRDLGALVEHQLAASQMASNAPLTELLNRRGFELLAEHSLRLCDREAMAAVLCFVDVEDLDKINETHGHTAGDAALHIISEVLSSTVRASDICGHIADEQFALFLPNTAESTAHELVDRINTELAAACDQADFGFPVAISVNVVRYYRDHHDSIHAMLAQSSSST